MNYLDAIILGIIEGLTEFLPISSTGHLILGANFLGLTRNEFIDVFEIFIQLGAIFAVVLYQWQKIKQTVITLPANKSSQKFALNIILATLPAVILGLLFGKWFKTYFFNPLSVSIVLVLGGIIILLVEKKQTINTLTKSINHIEDINIFLALKIGLLQCLALIPGTSRSGATIIGAMFLGVPRIIATEFSFFLAIPIIFGASLHDMYKHRNLLNTEHLSLLLIASVISFITAWLCIKWLIRFVSTNNFIPFAWYRVTFGLILLLAHFSGYLAM